MCVERRIWRIDVGTELFVSSLLNLSGYSRWTRASGGFESKTTKRRKGFVFKGPRQTVEQK